MSHQRSSDEVREGIQLFEQSVRLDPGFARAWAYLSDAYVVLYRSSRDKMDAERAVSAAQQACRLDDQLADAHFALGYAHSVVGQTSIAISETRRALELAPNSADGYRRLGRIYQDSGAKDAAISAFRRAVELNPHYWNTHLQLAAAYFRYGDNARAALHYQRVTEQVPERAEGFQGLATAYLQMGDFARSEAVYKKAISLQDRPSSFSGLATAYYFQGRYADAIRMYQKAIELAPKQELYYGNLGDACRWSGKADEARVAYQQAIALAHADLATNPQSASALGSLALYYAKLGEVNQSLDFIQRAHAIDPNNVGLQYNQAVVRALAGQLQQAVAALEQAVKSGYSWKLAAADPDLRPLHATQEFRALAVLERTRHPE
jgi:tetratricopeptide (TPR) repeat protein